MRRVITVTLFAFFAAGCGQVDKADLLSSTSGNLSADGSPALGSVTSRDVFINLRWQPNADAVAGYIVYYGPSGSEATVQASNLSAATAGFDVQSPTVTYNTRSDLGLKPGSSICFRLRAYNSQQALSPWSAPACTAI